MGYTGTDSYGTFTDTGCATAPTSRLNTEIESHAASEVDTGSKNTVVVTVASHGPHRSPNSPR